MTHIWHNALYATQEASQLRPASTAHAGTFPHSMMEYNVSLSPGVENSTLNTDGQVSPTALKQAFTQLPPISILCGKEAINVTSAGH